MTRYLRILCRIEEVDHTQPTIHFKVKLPSILELLSSKDQSLLVRGDSLLVLDLSLHVLDGVRGLHLQGDGLAR